MKVNVQYERNEEYRKHQISLENLLELLALLSINSAPAYWMDRQGLAHGFTHRVKNIDAFTEINA